MTNKELQQIKKEILRYLCEDFPDNQAIFDKREGWQVFNGTDLTMVMDKVVGGLIRRRTNEGNNNLAAMGKPARHRSEAIRNPQLVDEIQRTNRHPRSQERPMQNAASGIGGLR